ncbi:MAG: cache domain-containing protein [Candidatus Neomarinimicrobiota bacterium]
MNSSQGIKRITRILVISMIIVVGNTVMADDSAEVKALVEKGIVMAVIEGEQAALKAIGDPEGPFIKGEFYLFAGPLDKVAMSAHPYKPELVNIDLSTFRDIHNNFLFFEFAKTALITGAGWTDYWWPKPGASEVSHKKTYIMKVPGLNMYIGGGFYTE